MASPGGPTVFTATTSSRESLWSAVRFATGGFPHEPAHGARTGVDAGRVARDHARVLPSAGELHVAGGGPARGKLDGEPDAPAVRRPAPFEAGCGAGGREPAGDLMHPEADDRIGRRRLRRRVQPAERGGAATDQLPDIVLVRRRVRLRAGYGDGSSPAIGAPSLAASSCAPATSVGGISRRARCSARLRFWNSSGRSSASRCAEGPGPCFMALAAVLSSQTLVALLRFSAEMPCSARRFLSASGLNSSFSSVASAFWKKNACCWSTRWCSRGTACQLKRRGMRVVDSAQMLPNQSAWIRTFSIISVATPSSFSLSRSHRRSPSIKSIAIAPSRVASSEA